MPGEEEQAIRAFFESLSLSGEELTDESVHSLAARYFDPDVTYEEDPAWPGAATVRGRREVVDRFLEYAEVLGRASTTIESLCDAGGGRWAVSVRVGGESASGAPWDHLWGYTFEVRGGRIKSFRAYFDPVRAFDELGVSAGG